MSNQQHIVLVSGQTQSDDCCSCSYVLRSYKTSISKILGLIEIFIGISCIGLQIGALVHYGSAWSALLMQGIWCGPFFILAGAFALAAGKKNVRGIIVASLVLNIIALLFVIPVIALSVSGVEGDDQISDLKFYESKPEGNSIFFIVLITLGGIEAVTAITCAILACHGIGQDTQSDGTAVVYNAAPTQYVEVPSGAMVPTLQQASTEFVERRTFLEG